MTVPANRWASRNSSADVPFSLLDLQMLQWTAAGSGLRFAGLVHHTDAQREWAYDRKSKIGTLDKALDEASAKGWTVVDMRSDWARVYADER